MLLHGSGYTARSAQRDPPQTCAWSGGDFNLAGSCACKVEVPPTSRFQVGGGLQLSRHGCLLSWSPPHFKHKSGGGSRWTDLAVLMYTQRVIKTHSTQLAVVSDVSLLSPWFHQPVTLTLVTVACSGLVCLGVFEVLLALAYLATWHISSSPDAIILDTVRWKLWRWNVRTWGDYFNTVKQRAITLHCIFMVSAKQARVDNCCQLAGK